MKRTVTKTVSIELESGEGLEIEVEAIAVYDPHYGADADGNRGVGTWFIDEINYHMPSDLKKEQENEVSDKIEKFVIQNFEFDGE